MSSRADLESKTVPELKQICKDCDVKGYSKLAKDALITAIMEKKGQAVNLEQSLARSTIKTAPDPVTEQLLQRTSTKVIYSRDESEARIEKNKGLVAKRAVISGVSTAKATDSEAGAQLMKTTTGTGQSKHHAASSKGPASSPTGNPATSLASTLSATREAQVKPAPTDSAPAPTRGSKLVVQTSQIQKTGNSPITSQQPEPMIAVPVPTKPVSTAPVKSKKSKKMATTTENIQQVTPVAPMETKNTAKMVVTTDRIQKVTPSTPRTTTPPEPKETRFQDLPSDDRDRAFKNISKNVRSLLKMRKQDFLKKKAKDLEKYLEMLEVEKGRFTVYRPTEKAIRGFLDESIALINQVKEEHLNQLEQQYITHELPKVIKKNEQKIKQHINRIDRYYTDMDAARDIVEKFVKKAPFPQSYLITVVLQKIRDKAL